MSWLSFSSRPGNIQFAAFTTSYKNFKEKYFKIFVEPDDQDLLYNENGMTKFPFHWTEKPTQLGNWLWSFMSPFDKEILVFMNQLPYKFPTRELIALYGSSKKWADFTGIRTSCFQSYFFYV